MLTITHRLHHALALFCLSLAAVLANAENSSVRLERNHVYGMVSGTALLMDIYQPHNSNRRGVVLIPGSGWHADTSYQVPGLKDMKSGWEPGDKLTKTVLARLLDAGFTVFVPNHRAAPTFPYPAAVLDIARAVAHIRENAEHFAINGQRIGGVGHSSGGNLVSLMGTNDDLPEASRLQKIVTIAAPIDFIQLYGTNPQAAAFLTSYLGKIINFLPEDHPKISLYRQASSLHHIGPGDAPHLLIQGSDDLLVPSTQAEIAHEALQRAGVASELLLIKGGKHSEKLLGDNAYWLDNMANWFSDL